MRIGTSIGLIALGLILALAVRVDLGGIDLQLVGWILTVVGVIGLVASLVLARQARPVVRRETPYPPDPRLRETPYPPDPRM
jgi:predicted MFS family arabinose efflux permease